VSGQSTKSIDFDGSDIKTSSKLAIKYNSTNVSLYVNGFEIGEVSTGYTIADGVLTELAFDNVTSGDFYGNTSQIQYFNTALTDSELEKLTSWTSFIEMAQAQNYNII
jgi:hypothetical protein